jgi:hypothetical protein
MKPPVLAFVSAASILLSTVAFAQTTPTPGPAAQTAAPAPSDSAAAAPAAPSGKRLACQTASQALKGQDQRDQMQLCMAQAHLDCLKQAIDQKIVGPQRKDFLKTCAD